MSISTSKTPKESKKFIMTGIGIALLSALSALSIRFPDYKQAIEPIAQIVKTYIATQGVIDFASSFFNKA